MTYSARPSGAVIRSVTFPPGCAWGWHRAGPFGPGFNSLINLLKPHESESPSMSAWIEHNWVEHSQVLLDSYASFVGEELLSRDGDADAQAERLFNAPFVVVSHGTQADPLLNYANQTALDLWQVDVPTLLTMPSRTTAEPMHRDERTRLLERTTRDGFVDDYRGIRISSTGRRFLIDRATVWNLLDADGRYVGQAATFSEWTFLDD